jgi:hypothetical protein
VRRIWKQKVGKESLNLLLRILGVLYWAFGGCCCFLEDGVDLDTREATEF